MADGRLRLPLLSPPATRGDCEAIPRPCQRTLCRHNLGTRKGNGQVEFSTEHSCALDVAEQPNAWPTNDEAHASHRVIGEMFGGLTRERVRQIVVEATRHMLLGAAMEPDADALLDGIGATWADVLRACEEEHRVLSYNRAKDERKNARARAKRLARAKGER